MERIEYFESEKQIKAQKERDARALVKVPGKLVKEAERIVDIELKKRERSVLDFV